MRAVARFLPLVILIGLLLTLTALPVGAQAQSDPAQERAVIAAINQWRLSAGLSPLTPNPILMQMALDQAQFIMSLPEIPGGAAIHTGRRGEDPRARALYPQYNWPVYGQTPQLSLSEIAAARPNANGAVNFWQGSDIHNRTVMNGTYREIGAAAIPYRLGFVYLVVVGGQPNVLPAMADPRAGLLYLSNELYTRGQGNWLRSAQQVRLFDQLGRPLTDWVPWQAQLALPPNAGSELTVALRAGDQQVVSVVSLRPRDILLPSYADVWATGSLIANDPVQVVAAVPTQSAPTATVPSAAISLATNTPVPAAANPLPTVAALVPTVPPPTAIPPTVAPVVVSAGGTGLTLFYSPQTLTIVPDRQGVDISRIVLTDGTRTVRLGNVNSQFLRGTLTSLNARDCVLITTNTTLVSAPSGCVFVSTTFLTPDRALWQVDFRVERDGAAIGQCRAADRRCQIGLP